jgi:flagellar motor switch protein FliG
MSLTVDGLSGTRKAAILLVTLGADVSAELFKRLSDPEIEELTAEISRVGEVSSEVTQSVLEEFSQLAQARSYILKGGLAYAREVLRKAFAPARADEVLARLQLALQPAPFASMRKTDPKQLSDFIRREHPQTVALILANLEPEMAAEVMANLPPEMRSDVVLRLATMDTTSPEVVKSIDQVLEKRMASLFTHEVALVGGVKTVAEILNRIERSAEKQIFESLQQTHPQLAEDIRRLMFTFDDLVRLDDRAIQRVLMEIDQKDLAMALKAAGKTVTQKIFLNLSERARTMLKQEIEYLGPVRLRDVEEAQGRIVETIRTLEEEGQIFVAGKESEEILV